MDVMICYRRSGLFEIVARSLMGFVLLLGIMGKGIGIGIGIGNSWVFGKRIDLG